jgi:hypothetical protein
MYDTYHPMGMSAIEKALRMYIYLSHHYSSQMHYTVRRLLNLLDKRWQTAAKRVTIARERFIEAEACQQRDIDSTTTDHHAEPNGAPQESLSDARFQYPPKLQLVFPPPKLCTDNGVMVAWTGIEKIFKGISDAVDGADAEVIARWPLGTIIEDPELFKKPILK